VICSFRVPHPGAPEPRTPGPSKAACAQALTAARAAAGAAEVLGVDVPCVSAAFGSFAGLVAALEAHLAPGQQRG
jgi:hypothetical protein